MFGKVTTLASRTYLENPPRVPGVFLEPVAAFAHQEHDARTSNDQASRRTFTSVAILQHEQDNLALAHDLGTFDSFASTMWRTWSSDATEFVTVSLLRQTSPTAQFPDPTAVAWRADQGKDTGKNQVSQPCQS